MTTPREAGSPVDALADRFWEAILELNPTTATFYGDPRYADRLEDPGPEGRAKTRALMERTAEEARAIPTDGLPTEERITRDMLLVIAELNMEEDDQRLHELRVVDQMGGPQQLLPQMTQFQPADTPEGLEAFIARLHAYPAFMAANSQILVDGMHSGLTAPRIVTERTIAQIERMLSVPIEEAIVPSMAKVASDADRERIREIVRDVVIPADTAFLDTLRGEYRHASREEPGIWSAPNGDQIYRTAIRSWTTLDLDPEEVHRTGLDEIEQIEAERREIARAAGYGDDTRGLSGGPRRRPGQHAQDEGRTGRARHRGHRARHGHRAALLRRPAPRRVRGPRGRGVQGEGRAVRATTSRPPPTAHARASTTPTATTSRAASTPSSRSTTYHEAAPGHHFQITLEMENPHLNTFRRLGARMVGGAYVEGWGLYSERLADEMGLFRDEAERFGMLDAQAWRAARLVVDTGLHALRWERQRSVDFLQQTGLSETDAVIETDRYICWPGQALTYKVGQREIERLRGELAARDGSSFDLRAFHDAVLGHGSLPLATLSRELPTWVATPA